MQEGTSVEPPLISVGPRYSPLPHYPHDCLNYGEKGRPIFADGSGQVRSGQVHPRWSAGQIFIIICKIEYLSPISFHTRVKYSIQTAGPTLEDALYIKSQNEKLYGRNPCNVFNAERKGGRGGTKREKKRTDWNCSRCKFERPVTQIARTWCHRIEIWLLVNKDTWNKTSTDILRHRCYIQPLPVS